MTKNRRITISQVANEAGVSTQTVSRVINERPDVSSVTRRRVKDVIERLGYRHSHAARALRQGQSCSIGVVAQVYRNIGLITGPMDWWEARERARGWGDALGEAGL